VDSGWLLTDSAHLIVEYADHPKAYRPGYVEFGCGEQGDWWLWPPDDDRPTPAPWLPRRPSGLEVWAVDGVDWALETVTIPGLLKSEYFARMPENRSLLVGVWVERLLRYWDDLTSGDPARVRAAYFLAGLTQ
jgi:hypothetical protein